ncbi:23S rRNA (uracil(1939)-C(5))-methyltransferase RlmD [Anaerotruncus rubiinfantis]|uniref:23S rRNA (uracil(1939)-C(5))-methyltransferase RlmD n=3 Tax=Anaerotruncus rubiinfantis TaxID=1720200 RepID=UPI0034A437E4
MLQKNQIIDLAVTDMTHEGSGVGHYEGMAVFVPASAVGDCLRVRILKVNKTHCFGKIEQVMSPSPDRVETDCPVSRRCGGCVFQHVSYAAQLRYKQHFVQSNLERIGGFSLLTEPIEPSPQIDGYRNKAQYPVRMQKGKLAAGFFAPRTHEVIDCHSCLLQPPGFQGILESVLSFAEKYGVLAYDELSGQGLLRHVYLRCGQQSGEIMVCLVVNGSGLPHEKELVGTLRACNPSIVSILLNENTRNTNVILGQRTRLLYGKDHITDTLCGVRFDLSPHAFYQVNNPGAERLYGVAEEYASLTGEETVLDLYCGAGTIGLSLAGRCKQVIGVEIVAQAVENAASNAQKNGITNARFLCADAVQAAKRLAAEGVRPDVIILDPPRKGCEAALLDTVAGMSPQRIVMVSCNSATMARDCKILAGKGYTLVRCRPVDMFPHTAHVETVVLLSKGEVDSKKIRVEFSLEDMDMSEFQDGATYPQIKEYVLEHTGLKVSNLYISQIKRKCGIEVGKNYNLPKSEDSRQPQCPPEKEKAIREAFKYFGMI